MTDNESQIAIDKIASELVERQLAITDMREAMLRGEVQMPDFAEAVQRTSARYEQLMTEAEAIAVLNGIDLGPWKERLHAPFEADDSSAD